MHVFLKKLFLEIYLVPLKGPCFPVCMPCDSLQNGHLNKQLSQVWQKIVPQIAHNRPGSFEQVLLLSFLPEGGSQQLGSFLPIVPCHMGRRVSKEKLEILTYTTVLNVAFSCLGVGLVAVDKWLISRASIKLFQSVCNCLFDVSMEEWGPGTS